MDLLVEQLNAAGAASPFGVDLADNVTNLFGKTLRATDGDKDTGGTPANAATALAVDPTVSPICPAAILEASVEQRARLVYNAVKTVLERGASGCDTEAGREALQHLDNVWRRVGKATGI